MLPLHIIPPQNLRNLTGVRTNEEIYPQTEDKVQMQANKQGELLQSNVMTGITPRGKNLSRAI